MDSEYFNRDNIGPISGIYRKYTNSGIDPIATAILVRKNLCNHKFYRRVNLDIGAFRELVDRYKFQTWFYGSLLII